MKCQNCGNELKPEEEIEELCQECIKEMEQEKEPDFEAEAASNYSKECM